MKSRRILFALAALLVHFCGHIAAAETKHPDIVFILADDLGNADVGWHGGDIKTPNLDQLAAAGAKLESFYALPVCSPSRCALMTGRYPMRYGRQANVLRPGQKVGLSLDEKLLPQVLREAGYATAHVGKWHVGDFDPAYRPLARGFDHTYGFLANHKLSGHLLSGGDDLQRDEQPVPDEGSLTDLLTREALRVLEQRDPAKPLFLYLAYHAPHTPAECLPEFSKPYEHLGPTRSAYAGLVAEMDAGIGRVVAAIEKAETRENTLFIFASDNGGLTVKGDLARNTPFRGGKGSLYEGGVRVAAFATWDGHIAPGSVVKEPLHMVDWLPTLAKLGGATAESPNPLDGRDIWPVLTEGKASPHEHLLINTIAREGAVRAGDWKLVRNGGSATGDEEEAENAKPLTREEKQRHRRANRDAPDVIELFNLATDPSESKNLAAEQPDKVRELTAKLDQFAKEAVPPILKPEQAQRKSAATAQDKAAVSIEQDKGVWWFRSPAGERFLSIGANHVEPLYWQSPRNADFVRETYGGEIFRKDGSFDDDSAAVKMWSARVAANFKDWGFNTLGFHNPLSRSLQEAIGGYYVCHLPIPVPWGWNMKRSELVASFAKRPTDIFDARFRAQLDEVSDQLVKPRAGDSRLLGYAYTDGPPWTVDDDVSSPAFAKLTPAQKEIHPWVHALMSLPASAAGKQAWMELLKKRHADSAKAAAVYAVQASSWDELAAHTEWSGIGDSEAARADSDAFLSMLIRRWYEERARSIRRHDAQHLILGDKLNMNRDRKFPEQLAGSLRQMRGFVDVISVQYYAPADEQVETLGTVHRESGLPVMNGDTACTPFWPDNTLRGENPEFYQTLGQTYEETLTKLFAQPWFIGWHHCGYMRGLRRPYLAALEKGDAKESGKFERRGILYREGFITEDEQPIAAILTPLKAAIAKCEKLHQTGG